MYVGQINIYFSHTFELKLQFQDQCHLQELGSQFWCSDFLLNARRVTLRLKERFELCFQTFFKALFLQMSQHSQSGQACCLKELGNNRCFLNSQSFRNEGKAPCSLNVQYIKSLQATQTYLFCVNAPIEPSKQTLEQNLRQNLATFS